MSTPFTVKCDRWDECEKRHDVLASRVNTIEERVRVHGESIAALRAQVAMWAALGAIAGGGLASILVKLVAN